MQKTVRFTEPASDVRPYGATRLVGYAPKLARRITLYGENSLHCLIMLEADPSIITYCERPIVITDIKPKRVVDFWVKKNDQEELWLILRPSEHGWLDQGDAPTYAFKSWAETNKLNLRLLLPETLVKSQIWQDNWIEILGYLSPNVGVIPKSIAKEIVDYAAQPKTIRELEENFESTDSMIVRAAIFNLVHQGKLKIPDLEKSPLTRNTLVAHYG